MMVTQQWYARVRAVAEMRLYRMGIIHFMSIFICYHISDVIINYENINRASCYMIA